MFPLDAVMSIKLTKMVYELRQIGNLSRIVLPMLLVSAKPICNPGIIPPTMNNGRSFIVSSPVIQIPNIIKVWRYFSTRDHSGRFRRSSGQAIVHVPLLLQKVGSLLLRPFSETGAAPSFSTSYMRHQVADGKTARNRSLIS